MYKRQAVTRPETPSPLYLVDDLGNVYEMDKESQKDVYKRQMRSCFNALLIRTSTVLTEIFRRLAIS